MTNPKPSSYLWHRREWILSLLLLGLVVGTRILLFDRAGKVRILPEGEGITFQDLESTHGIYREVLTHCHSDVAFLCDAEYSYGQQGVWGCQEMYGRPLGGFLEVEGVREISLTASPQSNAKYQPRYKTMEWVNYGRERSPSANDLDCSLMNQFPDVAPTAEQTFVNVTEIALDKLVSQLAELRRVKSVQENALDQLLWLYLRQLFCFVKKGRAHREGKESKNRFTGTHWGHEKTLDLIGEAISNFWDSIHTKFPSPEESLSTTDAESTKKLYFDAVVHLSKHLKLMREDAVSQTFDWSMYCYDRPLWSKAERQIFDSQISRCMWTHYEKESLVTDSCAAAIPAASTRMKELELELEGGASFMLMTHFFMCSINFVSFLSLWKLFSSKRRMEKRMENGKRRLQQELFDPVLRQALERKAESLPVEERNSLIERLEKKLNNWDSKGAATALVQKYVWRFRCVVLFTLGVTTIMYVVLHFFHESSLPRYLEVAGMSLGLFTGSYWVTIEESDSDTNAIKTLLSDQDNLELIS